MLPIPEKYAWLETVDKKIYLQLIYQVKKDFELIGLSISLEADTTPEDLINEVANELCQLVQYHFEIFLQLLYRVDVTEKVMHSNEVVSSEELAQKATYELLKREWQKVESRNLH